MEMKHGRILCVLAVLVSAAWATDNAPKKFHTGAPPHHSPAQVEKPKYPRSSAGTPLPAKTQLSRDQELRRLEHQSTSQLHGSSAAKGGRTSGTASHVHAEPAGHSSSINFSYRAPHNQPQGASGA